MTSIMHIYTVSEITRELKNLIETSFPPLWVEGEITDLYPARSKHLYFSLKDERALLSCVMFKEDQDIGASIIKNGMMVRIYGELNLYEKGGRYSLIARKILPSGKGELYVKFEELKKKLEKEGLFDMSGKKKLPPFPDRIGIVTALGGAAIRDIVKVIKRRMRWVEIVVRNTKVQGTGAKEDIAEAIKELNEWGLCDIIVVTRGGGSIEDLWPFNEELVARAMYDSKIPVLSAVGHEIDYTLSDFVADARAATPSVAGEIVVKDAKEIGIGLDNMEKHLYNALKSRIENFRARIFSVERSYGLKIPSSMLYERKQWVDEMGNRLEIFFKGLIKDKERTLLSLCSSLIREERHFLERVSVSMERLKDTMVEKANHFLYRKGEKIRLLENRICDLSPTSVLERGYSICFKIPEMHVVSDSRLLSFNDRVNIKFAKGSSEARIEKVRTHNNAKLSMKN